MRPTLPALGLMLLLYGVIPWAQAWVFLEGLPFADLSDTLNFTASIVAYHWLLANVLLGLKIPVLQSFLPYDLRIRLHIYTSLGLAVLLAWHAVYTIFLMAKDIDLVSWTLAGLVLGVLVLAVLWIPLPGLRRLRSGLARLVRSTVLQGYDALKASHQWLTLVLAMLSYVHIVQSEILALVPLASVWVYHGLFVATVATYAWTRVRSLPTLEIRTVEVSGGIVRLRLAGDPRLTYRAGQFAFVRFDREELKGEEHPFSFTSARHENGVGFAIRALGDFTSKLGHLKPGDKVRVNGGFGAFHPPQGNKPLVLIGSGIGSAPLVSILKDLAHRDATRPVQCFLSVNRRDELIEPEALRSLPEAMPNLRLKVLVYDEDGLQYGEQYFAHEIVEPRRNQYFVCSSEKVRQVVVGALKAVGVPRGSIHFEAFNLG